MLITNELRLKAIESPNDLAILFKDKQYTYLEFYNNAKKVADHLQRQGYKKGDIVAQLTLNSELFLVIYYGIQMAGLTVMPINTKLTAPEIEYIIQHSGAKVLFYDESLEHLVSGLFSQFNEICTMDGVRKILNDDSEPIASLVDLDETETAVVLYTSGTTGKPKGVMLSHKNIYAACNIWADSLKLTNEDRVFICTPLFHCAGTHCFSVPTFLRGGTVIIEETFSASQTLDEVANTKATVFFGVPSMYTLLLNNQNIEKRELKELRLFCYGAAPMPFELVKQIKETFPHIKVQNLYGQTENTPAASSLLDEAAMTKIGSVGKPLPRTEIKLITPDGSDAILGEVGEICVKGEQVMKGYLHDPEATSKTVVNGWLLTGDLGRFDEEGYLYIVDRKKDMVIRGGENIYPAEIEEVLYQMKEILEVAVIGLPHEVYGEVTKCYVVLKEGANLTEEQVLAFCKEMLAKYKVPYEVEFTDSLPRNASGKVLKHQLRNMHETK